MSKIENKKRKEIKIRKTKEELCTKIENYGGLWKSCEEIRLNLARLTNGKEITEALKSQLKFRQKVFAEAILLIQIFHFSCKKDIFSNSKSRVNLENII